MYFIFINYAIVFGNYFYKAGRKIIGQFFGFSQRFIAGMIRSHHREYGFFKVRSRRDIDSPKAETRRHSGEMFLTGF
jgi:hypothetical protein